MPAIIKILPYVKLFFYFPLLLTSSIFEQLNIILLVDFITLIVLHINPVGSGLTGISSAFEFDAGNVHATATAIVDISNQLLAFMMLSPSEQ